MMKKTETEAGSMRHASANVLRRLMRAAVVVLMLCLVLAAPAVAEDNLFINVLTAPEVIVQGTSADFVINAEATDAGIQWYIFGPNVFENGAVTIADEGTLTQFTVVLSEDTTEGMPVGQYFAVFQHPMLDQEFQITADGTNIELDGTKIFNVEDLQAADAAQALCDALDAQTIDDLYVMYSFSVVEQADSTSIISISADKTTINFGTFTAGYTEPSRVPVTITNTGETAVNLTVSLDGDDYYSVGSSGPWALNPGDTVTLNINLDEGVAAGEYSGTFVISTKEDPTVTIELPVSFVVTPSSDTPPVGVWEADTTWWDENPWGDEYILYTANELAGLAVIANGNSMDGVTIKLGADIDLASQEWTPINFRGSGAVFEGQGHTISNLSIQNSSLSHCGLFGSVGSSVTVSNVTLRDVNILGDYFVGAFAGSLYDNRWYDGRVESPYIINCSVIGGTVEGDQQVGGFIGCASPGSQISQCISNVTVIGDFSVGGFIGDGGGVIHSCTVTSSITGGNAVGGMIGYAGENVRISSSCAVSSVESSGSWTGGLVGRFGNGNITDCYAGSILSANGYVGGIVGDIYHSVNITNSYSIGLITAENSYAFDSDNGGIIGSSGVEGNITITNSVALMQSVDGTSPTGRLTGYADAVIVNSYAWENMTNNGVYFSDGGINGTSVSSSEFWDNQSFFEDTLGWDFENTWKMNSGNSNYLLPVLQFMKTPVNGDVSYLTKEVIIPEPTPTPVEKIIVTTAVELADALNADVSGNVVTLTQDVTLVNPIRIYLNAGEEIILTTAGDYSLYRGVADNSLITVQRGTLTLKGKDSANQLTIDGRKDVYTENTQSLIYVYRDGCLILSDDAILTNNAAESGAGVSVGSNGHFEMRGGEISNNYARYAGSGVDVDGEFADYDSEGKVTSVEYGYFNMSGGRICNNDGKGLFNYGITTISGGEISNNTNGISSGGGELIITGGTIHNNTYEGVTLFDGGIGQYVDGDIVYRDTIGKLFISGDMVIPASERVWIGKNSTIIVTSPLSANAGIYNIQTAKESGIIVNATASKISGEDLLSHFVLNEDGYSLTADGYTLILSPAGTEPTPILNLQLSKTSVNKGDMLRISGETTLPAETNLTLGLVAGNIQDEDTEVVDAFFLYVQEGDAEMNTWSTQYDTSALEAGEYFFIIFATDNPDVFSNTASFAVTESTTPTPEKPAAPTLTPPESLPEDATVTTNTVAETNAATKAEVGYQVNPADVTTMKAPTITRGSLSVMLNDKVKVTKKLADGSVEEVEAKVNDDGTVTITGSLDDAESVTVNFIGRQFGDTIGNGKVGAVCALKIAQNIVGLESGKMSDTDKFYGDVNGDGNVKVVDALMIAQYTVGILDENYVRVA